MEKRSDQTLVRKLPTRLKNNNATSVIGIVLLVLILNNPLRSQTNEASPPLKQPHFIIYPVYSPEKTKEGQEYQTQMQEILEVAAKIAFEQLGISYEIASPLKPPSPDRFKVLVKTDNQTEVLQVSRKKDSENNYDETEVAKKIEDQLPPNSEVIRVYKEYNVASILNSTRKKLEEQLTLKNRTRDEYYILVADSNIFSDLYSNFVFWTSRGSTAIISQDVIVGHALTNEKTPAWASEQTAKLITSLVLQQLGVKGTNMEGCLTSPIYNAKSLYEAKLELNENVKNQLKSILNRELFVPRQRKPILREGTQEMSQTSYENSMAGFVKTALTNASNGDPRMLTTLIYGGGAIDTGITTTAKLYEKIPLEYPDLKAIKEIIENLDTSKNPKVIGYDTTTSPTGKIETTRMLFTVPQTNREDASVTMEILRYANSEHLIRKASTSVDPIGYKRLPEDPAIPSR